MEIQVFVTGGTIDGIDVDLPDPSKETALDDMFKQARIKLDIKYELLMRKDSRLVTYADREIIAKKCKECERDKIIVTHGTYTISETAQFLAEKVSSKTIVLVGSMIPFGQDTSDAMFNLGCALTAVQTLPPGVYATMEGQIYSYSSKKYKHEE